MTERSPLSETVIWPTHFPRNCPPPDADSLSHVVYYLVASKPPIPDDFRSALERGSFVGKPECQRASLSCGLKFDDISSLQKSIPRLRNFMVSIAKLREEHGKIMQTGNPGHYSLWLFGNALLAAPKLFEVPE